MEALTKIRDVSLRYGVSNRTLIYYEEMGLLQSRRSDGYAYRVYDAAALRRLEQILILRRLHISIKDIALIFDTRDSDVLLDTLARKVSGIDDEVALLHRLKQIVKDFIRQIRVLDFADGRNVQALYDRISSFEVQVLEAGAGHTDATDLWAVTDKLEKARAETAPNEGLYPVRPFLGGRYIDGIPPLRWGQSRDCTWAGSIKLLLDAIGLNASYPEIMGFSGACYHFSMTADWSPAAAMPQVAYDPAVPLARAIGVQGDYLAFGDLDRRVRTAIGQGMPVMLIQPRVEMEWGVLCGYTEDGRFYGRSYFDYLQPDEGDVFTGNGYFLADGYPGADPNLLYACTGRTAPFPLDEALKMSLEIARDTHAAAPKHNGCFVFGAAAYDILIDGLRRDDAGFAALTQYGSTGNGVILLTRLIDARRAAHAFWSDKSQYLPAENAQRMLKAAKCYGDIVSALGAVLPNATVMSTQNGYPSDAWQAKTRGRFADVLVTCKRLEQQSMDIIADALAHW